MYLKAKSIPWDSPFNDLKLAKSWEVNIQKQFSYFIYEVVRQNIWALHGWNISLNLEEDNVKIVVDNESVNKADIFVQTQLLYTRMQIRAH